MSENDETTEALNNIAEWVKKKELRDLIGGIIFAIAMGITPESWNKAVRDDKYKEGMILTAIGWANEYLELAKKHPPK